MMVVLCDMPTRVHGYIKGTCEPDGDYYTIVLNSRLSYEMQLQAYQHELGHIDHDDLHSERSVAEIELIRHK